MRDGKTEVIAGGQRTCDPFANTGEWRCLSGAPAKSTTLLPEGDPPLPPLVPEAYDPVDFMDREDTVEFLILHCPGTER